MLALAKFYERTIPSEMRKVNDLLLSRPTRAVALAWAAKGERGRHARLTAYHFGER
jgi:hypothetical protein